MDNDDLTGSVWDDAVSPNDNKDDYSTTRTTSSLHHSIVSPLSNQFNSLTIEDPFASPLGFGNERDTDNNDTYEEDEKEEEDEEETPADIDDVSRSQQSEYDAVGEQAKELKRRKIKNIPLKFYQN